jgi:hypothetical protein
LEGYGETESVQAGVSSALIAQTFCISFCVDFGPRAALCFAYLLWGVGQIADELALYL